MFAQPGDKDCPVEMYKRYAEKRPDKMKTPDSRFYVGLNPNYKPGSDISWFMNSAMGKNKLGTIAKVMSEKAKLPGRHTNHSGRKTTVTEQLRNEVPAIHVAKLVGHKNLMSLNSYNTMSIEQQITMSDNAHALNKVTASTSSTIARMEEQEMADTELDTELLAASQEIEEALNNIEQFEKSCENSSGAQVLNLPIVHHPDGTLSTCIRDKETSGRKFDPSRMFVNCTFNASVQFVLK
ncbi:uncharacterized protein LOC132726805 [Ruditapes philippinarum]|uniref:uncharacterized protein LOC132726805 n=1 Tax=Ruditapes philippinarum TaxID=129788 RepID=UPI00295B6689|nr:uncharacterized protein LOC132726805 [Ruditapes philippinarum]